MPSTHLDTSCSLCSNLIDSLSHLFFTCPIAHVVWRQSFWPLNSIALNVSNMIDWLLIILNPHNMIGIPQSEAHMFQIFVAVACNYIWFVRNKAHHGDLIPDALVISTAINKTVLEHHSAWRSKQVIIKEVRSVPPTLIL
jgi:hypothetical protein